MGTQTDPVEGLDQLQSLTQSRGDKLEGEKE